ncbi:hypothetical protein HMPREF1868_01593 [Olsenella sp. DNF00959]|nr:hypothetical protein HMPREF1868_01593 [Olsenella sp. DNF00959]
MAWWTSSRHRARQEVHPEQDTAGERAVCPRTRPPRAPTPPTPSGP